MPGPSWAVAADPVKFDEAVEWFRARVPMTDAQFYALDVAARRRAFGAAGIAQAHLAGGLHRVLGRAIADGTTLEDFKAGFEHNLEAAWGGPRPWQVENIFRTNLQLAYGAGRYKQLTDPVILKARPFWKYSAILDSRTSDICQPLGGTTLPTDDPFWHTHVPPLHFQCRSAIVALTKEQAEEDPEKVGLAPGAGDADPPLKGFGRPPELGEWAPDPTPLPKPIRALYAAKPAAPAPPPPPPAPVVPPEHTPDHWLATYKHFDDAAVPMAHARAALERGLDAHGKDVHKALGGIETPAAIRALLGTINDHSTLRQQLERTLANGSGGEDMIRSLAALHGHQQGLGAARVTTPEIRALWTEKNKPSAKLSPDRAASREIILRDFERQMTGFLSSRVSRFPSLKLSWEERRAYFSEYERKVVVGTTSHVKYDFVLAHEFAHSLEASDQRRGKAAQAFLLARTQGEVPKFLQNLMPHHGYSSSEVSTPDKFIDAYVGKRYTSGYPPKLTATEVTSMGIQWLFAKPAWFIGKDEDHFLFTLGQMGAW